MSKYKVSNVFKGDRTLWSIYLLLVVISLIEVFSAGSSLSFKSGNFMNPLFSQITYILVGLVIIFFLGHSPCRLFRSFWLIGIVAGILGLVTALALGDEVNGSARWISIAGFQVQPSEFVKPCIINGVAALMTTFRSKKSKEARLVIYLLAIISAAIVVGLIFSENFSTAALIGITIFVLFAISEVPWSWLAKTLAGGMFILVFVFGISKVGLMKIDRFETWSARIERFGNKGISPIEANRPDLVDLDRDGQETHAKIAIATSGFIGKGPGNSVQRDYLSQAYSDFIFAIIIEEFGLLGGGIVVALYLWMFYSCIRISRRCVTPFPSYLIIGLGTVIVLQALVNISVATGLIPITGQNLPLISRGGSSMLATSIMFGMMISVSRYARRQESPKELAKLSEKEREEALVEANFASMEPIKAQ